MEKLFALYQNFVNLFPPQHHFTISLAIVVITIFLFWFLFKRFYLFLILILLFAPAFIPAVRDLGLQILDFFKKILQGS